MDFKTDKVPSSARGGKKTINIEVGDILAKNRGDGAMKIGDKK